MNSTAPFGVFLSPLIPLINRDPSTVGCLSSQEKASAVPDADDADDEAEDQDRLEAEDVAEGEDRAGAESEAERPSAAHHWSHESPEEGGQDEARGVASRR